MVDPLSSDAFCWSAVLIPALIFDALLERSRRRHPEKGRRSLSRAAGDHPILATGAFAGLALHCQWRRVRDLLCQIGCPSGR